ncbi:MAG: LuxR C-terminal-related transcriptional regulator [Acidobacteriota bacterium]
MSTQLKIISTIPRDNPRQLTNRQKEVLRLLTQGLTNKQVANKLNVSVKTVDAHRTNIRNTLGIRTLPELVKYAIRTHLISTDD